MGGIKIFKCGFCKRIKNGKGFIGTRKGLRKHLREEHGFTKEITNTISGDGKPSKRSWWVDEEFK